MTDLFNPFYKNSVSFRILKKSKGFKLIGNSFIVMKCSILTIRSECIY